MNKNLYNYLLQIADDSVILGQRLGEWCGHGPALEIDMALTNISLDLFGQARSIYQYASEIEGQGQTEDDLAFLRDAWDFKNVLLVEQPNGDFAMTIARQYFFDAFQFELFTALKSSSDETLAAIATKSLKETAYHLRFSREWMRRLAGGTEESAHRLQEAVNKLWRYTEEMIKPSTIEEVMMTEKIVSSYDDIKSGWQKEVDLTLKEIEIAVPEPTVMQFGGRQGIHTEHLGFLLAEMQIMQRTYPGQKW